MTLLKKSGLILCLLATFVLTEVHWTVMQSITWIVMIQASEAPISLGEKIASAVSGKAPCDHCEALLKEKGASRSEVLSMIGHSPLLGPIPQRKMRPARENFLLFSLPDDPTLEALPGLRPSIPPPESAFS